MTRKEILILLAMALVPVRALASPVTFSFSSGGLGASAKFEDSGGNLIVTLTNTGTADAIDPTDILTAVYFDIAGSPSLSRVSAIVPLTSDVYVVGSGTVVTPGDRVVGGEWAYLLPPGISSTGLGIFGAGNLFPGPDLQPPPSPDGINLGIAPAGDNVLTGNGGIMGQWLIKNQTVFTLGGYAGNAATDISNVVFQYGTSLDEPQFGGVPEPSSLVLIALAFAGLVAFRARRRATRASR